MKIMYDESTPNEWRDAFVHEPAKSCHVIIIAQGVESGGLLKSNAYYDIDEGFKISEHCKMSNAWNVLVWRFCFP